MSKSRSDGFFVETRHPDHPGIPWTKQGCNEYGKRGGKFGYIPWPDRPAAEAAVQARKEDRAEFDDPMWAAAEYRIVEA